jgi:cytochrome c peroxidase
VGLDGASSVCEHVKSAKYGELYSKAYGGADIDCTAPHVAISFKRIALALSAWQHSPEVNSFSAARDKCPKDSGGNIVFPCPSLSAAANLGHDLFYGLNTTGKNREVDIVGPGGVVTRGPLNANCAVCHNSGRSVFGSSPSTGSEPQQLYTDHAYHNIGLPPNYEIENFNPNDLDFGLGRHADPSAAATNAFAGHVKTPTLRNVDKRRGNVAKAYMHNGYFKTLEDIVHFYNTAAEPDKVDPVGCKPGTTAAQAKARNCWPAPEIENATARGGLFGRLGLTAQEEAALVAYMKTFSDTNDVKAPSPYKPSKK